MRSSGHARMEKRVKTSASASTQKGRLLAARALQKAEPRKAPMKWLKVGGKPSSERRDDAQQHSATAAVVVSKFESARKAQEPRLLANTGRLKRGAPPTSTSKTTGTINVSFTGRFFASGARRG